MRSLFSLLLGISGIALAGCASDTSSPVRTAESSAVAGNEWFAAGQSALAERKAQKRIKGPAKNVILFIGDGMDPTTVAVARIFDGQSRGGDGEENLLSFEAFPHVAYSKTYTTDFQVPDSAGTASAMMTGVKTRSGVLSIDASAPRSDCAAALGAAVPTIAELAEQAGLATGVVSTAEITHATPGSVYAHSADRGWAADSDMPDDAKSAGCTDIATQLIEFPYGDGIDVALGGGRKKFTPSTLMDPETDAPGARADGRNLIEEWSAKSGDHRYVWNKAGFDAAPLNSKLLGLFEPSHLKYEADRADDKGGEPSLSALTAKAIEILSQNENGFFLMVEAGKIDHAHHGSNAYRALTDTQAYGEAVKTARAMTSEKDTLIIVTADHGHTMAFQGYPRKGNNILGLVTNANKNGDISATLAAGDKKPYTTLSYANGPSAIYAHGNAPVLRPPLDPESVLNKDYRQLALIPTGGETHGGQDVGVYASGPNAHLISGVIEQNYIFHVMADALELVDN